MSPGRVLLFYADHVVGIPAAIAFVAALLLAHIGDVYESRGLCVVAGIVIGLTARGVLQRAHVAAVMREDDGR